MFKSYLIPIRYLFTFFDYFSIELVVFSILICIPSLYIRELTFYQHCKLYFTFLVCHCVLTLPMVALLKGSIPTSLS